MRKYLAWKIFKLPSATRLRREMFRDIWQALILIVSLSVDVQITDSSTISISRQTTNKETKKESKNDAPNNDECEL